MLTVIELLSAKMSSVTHSVAMPIIPHTVYKEKSMQTEETELQEDQDQVQLIQLEVVPKDQD